MAKTLKLKSKTEYLKYLDTVSKIIDTGVIFDVKEDKLVSLASSLDSTLILHSEYKSDFSFSDTLNIPDVKKLRHVLDTIEEESVDIEVNNNNLQYKGNGVKFKYIFTKKVLLLSQVLILIRSISLNLMLSLI